jgi:hypothetical protein
MKSTIKLLVLCLIIAATVNKVMAGIGDENIFYKVISDSTDCFGKTMIFYNSDGTILEDLKIYYYPSVSSNKNKIAVIERSSKDSVSIYDRDGRLINRFKTPKIDTNQFFFGIEKIAISNNGSLVTVGEKHGNLFSRIISFYDSSITHIADVEVEDYAFCVAYMDNDLIAVLLQSRCDAKTFRMGFPSVAELRCYQITGQLKWKYQINDLNYLDADSNGRSLEKQGIDVLNIDEAAKKIYVVGVSNLGKTSKELNKQYKRAINPKGKSIWIFNYEGKRIEKKVGW